MRFIPLAALVLLAASTAPAAAWHDEGPIPFCWSVLPYPGPYCGEGALERCMQNGATQLCRTLQSCLNAEADCADDIDRCARNVKVCYAVRNP